LKEAFSGNWKLTAIEQPPSDDLSINGASSGNAKTLMPFAIRACVMLKSGASNSPVWAYTTVAAKPRLERKEDAFILCYRILNESNDGEDKKPC